jgi:Na+/melibiose symporter-like transporter
MWDGPSACSNSNSFDGKDGRFLPWLFRAAMPVVVTNIMGG